jgi:hypothetical protein
MLELLTKLLPVMLFWLLAALYLGGWAVDLRGGRGPTQIIGLLLSFVLFVVVWKLLHRAFLGFGEILGGIVITTFITAALLPAVAWLGYKMVGVTVTPTRGGH